MWIDFKVCREQLRLADVLLQLGFVPSGRVGDQLRGPCPVHGSTSPRSRSFSANLNKGYWHCFKCHSSGGPLDLWAQVHRVGPHEAAVELAKIGLWKPTRNGEEEHVRGNSNGRS